MVMSNKKGFTLIEILGVIVVLGLIAVIVTPKIIDTIKDSKKKSYNVSVNNLVKALSGIAVDRKANLVSFDGCSYNFDTRVNTCSDLEYSGELPTSGSISVDKDGHVFGSVGYDGYEFYVVQNNVMNFPIDYARVEYIESTGTQYINTGYIPGPSTDMEIEFSYLDVNNEASASWYPICGERSSSGYTYLGFWIHKSNHKIAVNYGLYDSIGDGSESISEDVRYNLQNHGSQFFLNNNIFTSSTTQVTKGTTPIYIFTIGNGSSVESRHVLIKLYLFKIYENEELVRYMIPCYRKSDEVAGLYDVIEGVFYANSGTGSFVISD